MSVYHTCGLKNTSIFYMDTNQLQIVTLNSSNWLSGITFSPFLHCRSLLSKNCPMFGFGFNDSENLEEMYNNASLFSLNHMPFTKIIHDIIIILKWNLGPNQVLPPFFLKQCLSWVWYLNPPICKCRTLNAYTMHKLDNDILIYYNHDFT